METRYCTDNHGRNVIAHRHAFPPRRGTLRDWLAAEQYRFQLGAIDLEESRRGITLVSITDGQLTAALGSRGDGYVIHGLDRQQENVAKAHE